MLDGAITALGVAVSGGPDSLCLAHLVRDWAPERGIAVTALIVNHQVRAEADEEARLVSEWLTTAGIPSHVLTLTRDASKSTELTLRSGRMRALQTACKELGIPVLMVAHHLDDQRETVLYRMGHGSGVSGYRGIAPLVAFEDVCVCRPLLTVDKTRILSTLRARRLPFVMDPTNALEVAQRNIIRKRLRTASARSPTLLPSLDASIAFFGSLDVMVEKKLQELSSACVRFDADVGYAYLHTGRLARAPPVLAARLLHRVVAAVGGRAPGSPHSSLYLELFRTLIATSHKPLGRLGVCFRQCSTDAGECVLVHSSTRADKHPTEVRAGQPLIFENRMRIVLSPGAEDKCTVAKMTSALLHSIVLSQPELRAYMQSRSRPPTDVLKTLPVVFDSLGRSVAILGTGLTFNASIGCSMELLAVLQHTTQQQQPHSRGSMVFHPRCYTRQLHSLLVNYAPSLWTAP